MVFNITEHVQGVQYLLRFWRSDGVLNLNTHFYSVVFDLFCIFLENTHEQQLIQAKILYQCPSRNILDFVYGGSHFSTGVIFLRVRHVKNRLMWHFFYTWDTFFYGKGSFLYDEKWPLGRFSTGVVIRRYTGTPIPALYDQPPTYSWCNHAHYAQYRTNPRSDFDSWPQITNSSKCNAGFSTQNAHMAHIVNSIRFKMVYTS